MDRNQFNVARFELIGLPPINTYVVRSDNRDEFDAKLRPLLEAFGKSKIPSIEDGDFHNLPLWIFDDYLLTESICDSYESVGIPLLELGRALKAHGKKLDKAKLKAIAAVEALIELSVSEGDKGNLKQAISLINGCAADDSIKPYERELFFSALVCLSFHYCFKQIDFKPTEDGRAKKSDMVIHEKWAGLKPIARIVSVFYGEDSAIAALDTISSKIKYRDRNVAVTLAEIISGHLGLWGQFMRRNC